MDILRTPAERFESVPDFNWPITYIDDLPGYQGLRTAVLDTGPGKAAGTFLCLHGEPTWSFLYRKMIAVFVAAGHRVVAPDLIGFGRSDKPLDDAVYTFDFHRGHLIALLERLDLNELTLVCQDWGGILGLTLPMVFPDRFDGLVVMNTMLGTGDQPLSKGFIDWRAYVARNPDLDCARLLARSTPFLNAAEAAAYDAPFPDVRFKAATRARSSRRARRRDFAPGARLVAKRLDRPNADGSRPGRPGAGRGGHGQSAPVDPQLSGTNADCRRRPFHAGMGRPDRRGSHQTLDLNRSG